MQCVFGLWSLLPASESHATFVSLASKLCPPGAQPHNLNAESPPVLLGAASPSDFSRHDGLTVAGDLRLDSREELLHQLSDTSLNHASDLDLIAAAWRRWSERSLERICGAFAFALWSKEQGTLWLVRDHAGERPLFYTETPGFLAFASTPAALSGLPGVAAGVDEQRILDTLTIFPPQWTASFLNGIKRVPPGHFLRVTASGATLVRYWHPSDAKPIRLGSDRAYEEALVATLDRATRDRMRTSGGIGSQMSAGLDSTSVTASAAVQLASEGRGLTAFTAIPRPDFNFVARPQDLIDEGPGAAALARMYPNIDHVLVDTSGESLLSGAQSVTRLMGEPLLNIGNYMWMAKMFDLARERGITVMLNGSHGNATISYDGISGLRELFRQRKWGRLAHAVRTLRHDGEIGLRNAAATALDGLLPLPLRRLLQPRMHRTSLRYAAISPKLAFERRLDQRAFDLSYRNDLGTAGGRRQFYERFDFGGVNFAFAAQTGIEYRDPTGDKRVWEFCYGVPLEQFLADGHSRSLVRRAMRHRLPPEIVNEYRTGLQGADWYLTVREAVPELLAELDKIALSPSACRLLDLDRMRWLLHNWPQDNFEQAAVTYGWNFALTRGIILGYFIRINDPAAIAQTAEGS